MEEQEQFSWRRILKFLQISSRWLERNPKKTKPSYALHRVLSRCEGIQSKCYLELEDIDIKYASTDEGKNILYEADGITPKFQPENKIKRNNERQVYFDKCNISVEPFFMTQIPNDLSYLEIESFRGFVLSEEQYQQLMVEPEEDQEKGNNNEKDSVQNEV